MGRAWRIEYEGGLYHVLSRRNERKGIFHDNRDRRNAAIFTCQKSDFRTGFSI